MDCLDSIVRMYMNSLCRIQRGKQHDAGGVRWQERMEGRRVELAVISGKLRHRL